MKYLVSKLTFTELNLSKLGTMLTTSSCVFVPVDDPTKDLLDNIAEVSIN